MKLENPNYEEIIKNTAEFKIGDSVFYLKLKRYIKKDIAVCQHCKLQIVDIKGLKWDYSNHKCRSVPNSGRWWNSSYSLHSFKPKFPRITKTIYQIIESEITDICINDMNDEVVYKIKGIGRNTYNKHINSIIFKTKEDAEHRIKVIQNEMYIRNISKDLFDPKNLIKKKMSNYCLDKREDVEIEET